MVSFQSSRWLKNVRCHCNTFGKNTDGAVAIMYAISFAALVAITALAYDIARAHYARAHLNSTIDAIAVGIGAELQNLPLDITTASVGDTPYEQKLIRIAKSYIIGNIGVDASAFLNFSPQDVNISIKYAGTNSTPNVAEISGTVDLPLTLAASFFNLENVEARASAKVNREVRGMELALALDTSGSMDGSKMTTLKTAVSSLLDILYAGRETVPDFYVSIVPFADDSINVATNTDWLVDPLNPNPNPEVECAKNRTNGNHDNGFRAEKPLRKSKFYRGDTCYSEWQEWVRVCNPRCHWERQTVTWHRSPILELTAQKTTINNLVQDIEPRGATSTNVGLAWAWRTISPKWSQDWTITENSDDEVPDTRPVAYQHEVIDKTIIFMTDGKNTNTSYTASEKNTWYTQTCNAIKDKGIEVFTIAFAMSASDEGIYKNCATSEAHFFSADNNSELQNAFEAIARVMKLEFQQL